MSSMHICKRKGLGESGYFSGVGHSFRGEGYLVNMEHVYILPYRILENEGLNRVDCVGDNFVDSHIYLDMLRGA